MKDQKGNGLKGADAENFATGPTSSHRDSGNQVLGNRARLEAALKMAAKGYPVVPLKPRDKQPACNLITLTHGTTATKVLSEAAATPEQVEAWFRQNPDINFGVFCGKLSRFVALDVDHKTGGDDAFYRLVGDEIPPVPIHRSGAGFHVLLPYPGAPCSFTEEYKSIMIRGEGSYIVWPPSRHPRGGIYEVIQSLDEYGLPQQEWFTRNIHFGSQPNLHTAVSSTPLPSHSSGIKASPARETESLLAKRLAHSAATEALIQTLERKYHGKYPSRSEFDMAFICCLIRRGFSEDEIRDCFLTFSSESEQQGSRNQEVRK